MGKNEKELYEKLKKYVNEEPLETGPFSGGPEGIPDIYKMPIIGYAVIKSTTQRSTPYMQFIPVCPTGEDFDDEELVIHEWDQIVGFIPAAGQSFKVFGCYPDATVEELILKGMCDGDGIIADVLGYEFAGAPHLDWEAALRSRWIQYAWGRRGTR